MKSLRLALAQINSTVGDLKGNAEKISALIKKGARYQADIIAFPELALTGYPPEDLLLKPQFVSDNLSGLKKISSSTSGITSVIGFVDSDGRNLYNAAAVISECKIIDVYHKIFLPNYGVFDEQRYFKSGKRSPVYNIAGSMVGISICEDIWHKHGPAETQAASGAEVIVNINASPYEMGKPKQREKILQERSSENCVIIAYLNTVGGQDELVFDGFSMVYNSDGQLIARARQFEEDLMVLDLDTGMTRKAQKARKQVSAGIFALNGCAVKKVKMRSGEDRNKKPIRKQAVKRELKKEEEVYKALVLGTSDYVKKNNFSSVVIGLSGGVDSSVVAAIAADAIGRENVTGLFMPSTFTSSESYEDANELADNLGIAIRELAIDKILNAYLNTLSDSFKGRKEDITEENLQARIRGNLLMAFSNKFGSLVLTTGNKSEMSVGYATLYGDMAGGFAVIKDVSKTLVYEICEWRNSIEGRVIIPERVLWKEPTAELRPGQKDSDSLPPYAVLDPVLRAYIEDEISFEEIVRMGCDPETAEKVVEMVDRSEYKRRQAPPGIKITSRAFGRDRRFPITNRYRSY
jgi:NAD+ synthase (glutamine-hydrolysing)